MLEGGGQVGRVEADRGAAGRQRLLEPLGRAAHRGEEDGVGVHLGVGRERAREVGGADAVSLEVGVAADGDRVLDGSQRSGAER